MADEKRDDNQSLLDKLITLLSGCLAESSGEAWKIVQQMIQGRSLAGMYEVLEYESTLELKDRAGKRATFKKREKVRYLQDNIIAYQDQAWGMARSSSTTAVRLECRWINTDPATKPTSLFHGGK